MSSRMSSAFDRLGSLPKDRMELLKRLRELDSRDSQRIKPFQRDVNAPALLPTSWGQQRLWFIEELEEGRAGYQVLIPLRLRGRLDLEALQRSLDALVDRHESLRTAFVNVDGEPMQRVMPKGTFPTTIVDLTVCPEADRESQVRFHKNDEVSIKFHLETGPMARGRLLQLRADEHVLLLTIHHIVCDGWSKGVLIRELTEFYAARVEKRSPSLQPLPIQYGDYSQWQRQYWAQTTVVDKGLSYWRARLGGTPPQLELPTDRPRPAVPSYKGENIPVVLDAQLSSKLRLFARENQVTLFMVLCTGLAILLSRLSGQDDVVVGSPIANRQRPEVEGLIGLFINMLALRITVSEDASLDELLEHVKGVTLGAYDHQDLPFEKVVETLQPERSRSTNPLFQVVFVLHNEPRCELCAPDLTGTLEEDVDEPAILDLWFSLEERGDVIAGSMNFPTELFDRSTIERWMASYVLLLNAIGDGIARRPVKELPSLPEDERREVIEGFNAARAAPACAAPIHQMFEDQVRRAPDSFAVTHLDKSVTYSELNSKANQLAHFLREKGVGPDELVGLCVERELDLVVGILGILKAGGAYLPLDPAYPSERMLHILTDAAPRMLLTHGHLRAGVPYTATKIVALDDVGAEIALQPTSNPPSVVGPNNLAYVIYTSGSTGQPKGVMIEHRNVTRLFDATEPWFGFNKCDVWTLFHSFAFDFSVWELWGALLYGGRLVIVPQATTRSADEFYELLCTERVTVLNQTPSAFAQLIDAQERSSERHSLRIVVFGGEALELRTLRRWSKRNGVQQPKLINMYGITETTVHVTYLPLTQSAIDLAHGSPIGIPIPDLTLYLLDRYRRPVPIGVIGEMYVGGAGVARGYLNRPELTGERFIPDPFGHDAGARLYKSGDLARWRSDGTLEYIGRNDHQVKIRGYRIELGEIEAQIARHPQVKEAVVVARQEHSGEKRLVAYVIGDRGAGPQAVTGPSTETLRDEADATDSLEHSFRQRLVRDLREQLKARLPEYMVPSAWVLLQAFPLTANGKLDRRALPEPYGRQQEAGEYVAPRTDTERRLAEVWAQLLQVDRVGVEDNFFELGGHSLLGMRLIARVKEHLNVVLPAAAVFEFPTVDGMAKQIDSRRERMTPASDAQPTDVEEGTL